VIEFLYMRSCISVVVRT